MCLSYAKGIYHINIEFILNGSKISLSSKEHKQTTISNVLSKTIAVLHDFIKKNSSNQPKMKYENKSAFEVYWVHTSLAGSKPNQKRITQV